MEMMGFWAICVYLLVLKIAKLVGLYFANLIRATTIFK